MRRMVVAAVLVGLFPSAVLAGKTKETPATVCVVDQDGAPVSNARIRVVQESDQNHMVNTVTGCWTSSAMYNDLGGSTTYFAGMVLDLVVGAPGYAPQDFGSVVTRSRLTVTLEPIPDVVDFPRLGIDPEAVLERPLLEDDLERMAVEAADLMRKQDYPAALAQAERTLALSPEGGGRKIALAVRAHSETALWRQASEAWVEAPSSEDYQAVHEASRQVVAAARAWLSEAGLVESVVPRGLCVSATLDRSACEP